MRRTLTLAIVVALVGTTVLAGTSVANARDRRPAPAPTVTAGCTPLPTSTPTPTGTPTPKPTSTPTPTTPPTTAGFREDFTTPAAVGKVDSTYPQSWQPYPDGTGGRYYSDQIISVHDGYLDVALDGKRGAAGTFGTRDGAWDHKGGTFTVRAKATGGDGNGAAFMLWPTSDVWSDGEIDFPEGNFDDAPSVFHHSMTPGDEADAEYIATGVDWRSWHTYSETWVARKSITYSVDGKVIGTITHDVPTSEHRYMFQVGNWGNTGHLLIDYVETP